MGCTVLVLSSRLNRHYSKHQAGRHCLDHWRQLPLSINHPDLLFHEPRGDTNPERCNLLMYEGPG